PPLLRHARRVCLLPVPGPCAPARVAPDSLPPPVVTVRLPPLLPVSRRAADIRRKHNVPRVDEELGRHVPLAVMLKGRPTVDVDDRWRHALAAECLGVRNEEERVNILAIRARLPH